MTINLNTVSEVHEFIVGYLEGKCGGTLHSGAYGINGRYVTVMTDKEYSEYQNYLIDKRKQQEIQRREESGFKCVK